MFDSIGTVAVAQFSPDDENVWKNLDTLKTLAMKARLRGASILVFPELCLSKGWFESREDAAQFAQAIDGYQSRYVADVANATMMSIVFGYVEYDEDNYYNSAALVRPSLGVSLNVRKRNLSGFEYMWATPGEGIIAETSAFENCRVGILVGDDAINMSHNLTSKFYEPGSIDLICVPDARYYESVDFPQSIWFNLSLDTSANVAVANKIGVDITTTYGGGSCFIDRDQRVWTSGASFDEETIVGGALT